MPVGAERARRRAARRGCAAASRDRAERAVISGERERSGAAAEPSTCRARERFAERERARKRCEQSKRARTSPTNPIGDERACRCAVSRGGAPASRDRAERAAISGERERERRGGRAAHEPRTRTTTVARGRARWSKPRATGVGTPGVIRYRLKRDTSTGGW